MLKTLFKFCNDNHWFIIAGIILTSTIFWTYGCQSQVESLITPEKLVCRAELQNELQYIIGTASVRVDDLDRQDEIKQALLDAVNIIGTTGTINPSGLINLAASIGAISFALNRNQKLKSVIKTNGTTTA